MKINTNVEKPWVKEFLESNEDAKDCFFPLVEIKITTKGGYILITDSFKAYLFPDSKPAIEFAAYLESVDNKDVPVPGIFTIDQYPYWELSDDTTIIKHLHNYDDREIQILEPSPPTPSKNARTRKKTT